MFQIWFQNRRAKFRRNEKCCSKKNQGINISTRNITQHCPAQNFSFSTTLNVNLETAPLTAQNKTNSKYFAYDSTNFSNQDKNAFNSNFNAEMMDKKTCSHSYSVSLNNYETPIYQQLPNSCSISSSTEVNHSPLTYKEINYNYYLPNNHSALSDNSNANSFDVLKQKTANFNVDIDNTQTLFENYCKSIDSPTKIQSLDFRNQSFTASGYTSSSSYLPALNQNFSITFKPDYCSSNYYSSNTFNNENDIINENKYTEPTLNYKWNENYLIDSDILRCDFNNNTF